MADSRSGWLDALYRESGIRRGIVLHGNVLDVVPDDSGRWVPTLTAVVETLKRRKFDHVVTWDRFEGPTGVDAATWDSLQSQGLPVSPLPPGAETYDTGESAEQPKVPASESRRRTPSPEDFFATVASHLRRDSTRRVAFVIDWSQYLFGTANALSETERMWLLILGKAVRDSAVSLEATEIAQPTNLLVLVSSRLGSLPPSLYQNNPAFKEIAIPLPSREQREDALRRVTTHLNLVSPLVAGTRQFADLTDALDGFTLRDMHQLVRLSRQSPPSSPDELVNLYRYGERASPWEGLNRAKLANISATLGERVKGQEEAIAAVSRVIVRAFTGLSGLQHSRKQRTPKGALFFVGPTGVGKTELAKSLAQFLFGDEDACLRFDMSEFNHEHADQRLVGAPPGYVGYEEGGQLTNAVKRRPFSVVLFDEIEKAHPRILDKFLQILEDGRLTDGKGDTVSFGDTVLIFTSNIGAASIVPTENPETTRQSFTAAVREHFVKKLERPELLGRIGDNIVPFNFVVDEGFLLAIARVKLGPLRELLLEKYGILTLAFVDEERALGAIVADVDRTKGGRGVLNALVSHLFDPLAQYLFTEVPETSMCSGRSLRVVQGGRTASFAFELV